MISVAILTISDSSHQGSRQDKSGPALREIAESREWQVACTEIIPDERTLISRRLKELAESGEYAVILTTGGTGVAPRDVTPDATRDIMDREIPGLGELMRMEGLKHTPLAVLSRSMGSTLAGTLIVNLPGSPKGAVESLNAIVNLIPHIVDLLHGRTEHPAPLKRSNN